MKVKNKNNILIETKINLKIEEKSLLFNKCEDVNDYEIELSKIPFKSLVKRISYRGPDFVNLQKISFHSDIIFENQKTSLIENPFYLLNFLELFQNISEEKYTILLSSVLALRGINKLTTQPINIICNHNNSKNEYPRMNFLMYNGEIYNIKENIALITESKKNKDCLNELIKNLHFENDTLILSKILAIFSEEYNNIKDSNKNNKLYSELFFRIHRSLESDHALVYYDNLNKKVLINRDLFGKRSLLLIRFIKNGVFFFSSNINLELYELIKNYPDEISVFEVPANTVIIIDLENLQHNLNDVNKHELRDIFNFFYNPFLKTPSELRFKNEIAINEGMKYLYYQNLLII